jgi:hypothetical protein
VTFIVRQTIIWLTKLWPHHLADRRLIDTVMTVDILFGQQTFDRQSYGLIIF